MNARVVGLALLGAIAALGAPSHSGAESLALTPWGPGIGSETVLASSGTMMLRRQPAPVQPRRTPTLRRQRKGTISLGGQLGYGFVRGSSELNDHFDGGLGYGFRFRYMLSPSSALAFSFENQRYATRAGLPPDTGPFAARDSELVVTTVASEFTAFFHREREFTPYLLGGVGFASPNVNYETKESRRVDEGPFVVVGAGFERFFRPRVSLDVTLRGYAEVGNSELSLLSQLTAGIHLYPGD
jgi:hypothetical protein